MTHFKRLLLPSLFLALVGCDQVHVEDNMDEVNFLSDLRLFGPASRTNDLNGPYAAGTEIEFRVVGEDDTAGWSYESDNPEIVQVMGFAGDTGTVFASGSGNARLRLLDESGDCVEEFDIEIADVAEVAVTSNAIIESEGDVENNMAGETLYVLEGGVATFRTRFFDAAGRELRGRNLVEVRGELASTAMTDFSSFSAWLNIAPFSAGANMLALSINGVDVTTLNIEAISPDDLEALEIVGDEIGAVNGDEIVLRTTGLSSGNSVYGVEPDWTSGGRLLGSGDLYSYRYDAAIETPLEVTFETASGNLESSTVVHGSLGDVSSSTNLGCSTGGGASGFGALFPLGLGLLFLRRRR